MVLWGEVILEVGVYLVGYIVEFVGLEGLVVVVGVYGYIVVLFVERV